MTDHIIHVSLTGLLVGKSGPVSYLSSPDGRLIQLSGKLPTFGYGEQVTLTGELNLDDCDNPVLIID